eukprot:2276734-Rhodomonas_salina.2
MGTGLPEDHRRSMGKSNACAPRSERIPGTFNHDSGPDSEGVSEGGVVDLRPTSGSPCCHLSSVHSTLSTLPHPKSVVAPAPPSRPPRGRDGEGTPEAVMACV